jgi:hypothetical protein
MNNNEWQPIETAPKDSTLILLWGIWSGEVSGNSKVKEMHLGCYYPSEYPRKSEENFDWVVIGGDMYGCRLKPTHWMPLPKPPKN